jgi:NACHT domain
LRPRTRGITLLLLSAAALAGAVGLSALGRASPAVQVIPFALGIPGLYIGWLTYKNDRSESARAELGKVADELATSVKKQWNTETKVRQLNNSDYLSVSWEAAPADLFDSWATLVKMVEDTPGRPRRLSDAERRPPRLSGSDRSLSDVMKRVPTRRLVVLGEPGSGKTILLIRLLLELLIERDAGTAVPVLVPVASWNPSTQDLRTWLITQLVRDYPSLKNPWTSTTKNSNLAEALLDEDLFLIILDGLDEIPEEIRGTAISEINEFLPLGAGIVLSCRTGEYRKVLHTSGTGSLPTKLAGAAGVVLCALDDKTVKDYFQRKADGHQAITERWDPVLRELGTSAPVAEALGSPLMVGLAHAVYDSRSDESTAAEPLKPPAELCNVAVFPTRDAVEEHLFRAFVPAAYRPRKDARKNRWNEQDAERWLAFLADYFLQEDRQGILEWWNLRAAAPGWLVPAVVGIISGIASGLAAGFGRHVGFGIGIGLGVGAFVGLAVGIGIRHLSRNKGRPVVGIAGALIGAIAGGVLGGVAGKVGGGHAVGPSGGLAVALAVGIGVGSSTNFVGGLAGGLSGGFLAVILEGFGKGLPAGLVNGAGMGLAAALAARFVGRETPAFRLRWSWIGAVCGLAIGTAVGLITAQEEGLPTGLIAGTVIGLVSALPCSLTTNPQQDRSELTASSPRDALRHDYRTFLKTASSAGFAAAIAGLLGGGLVSVAAVKAQPHLGTIVSDGLGIGLAAGVIIGLGFGLYHAASGSFVITRLWLACRRELPWQLMSFLDDAHRERLILRQSGTVYQFRHIELQRWLASQHKTAPAPSRRKYPRPIGRVIPGHSPPARSLSR